MKKILLICFCFFLSCVTQEEDISHRLIKKEVFIKLLKDVHLVEAEYEINKKSGAEFAKNILKNNYIKKFEKYNTSAEMFNYTLSYYSYHPEELESIYTKTINLLNNEKSTENLK